MNILVTGGAGFIGTRLVRALLDEHPSARIFVYDNLHPQVHGTGASWPDMGERVECVRGDVASREDLRSAVRHARPQLVYHLAAETGTGQSYDELSRYCNVNVQGTAYLIEAIREVGSVERVVLAGSRAVYGEGGYRDAQGREFTAQPRSSVAMSEGRYGIDPPEWAQLPVEAIASHSGLAVGPSSIYASTKLMQEYLLQQAAEGASWSAVVLRFQNVYGPGQSMRNPYTGVLSIFSNQLLSGKDLEIYEDGDISRDFVFVDDVVGALARAGSRDVPHGTVIDIGTGQAVTILAAARVLAQALGRSDAAITVSGKFRAGDIRYAAADIRTARSLLGWEPSISVDAGLSALAHWASEEFDHQGHAR